MFKVLRNGLLRYILYTCPNLWCNSCSKCYGMDCFGTYFTHVQTCDVTRVQSATEWTASVHTLHMSKPVVNNVGRFAASSKKKKSKFWQLQGCIVVQDFFRCSQLWKGIVRLVPKEPVLWALPTLFTLMPWIGLKHQKKSNEAAQVKKRLKTPYCRVGERPGLRVFIYIYINTHISTLHRIGWL